MPIHGWSQQIRSPASLTLSSTTSRIPRRLPWHQSGAPLLAAVDEASESYFTSARNDFNRGDTVSGTGNLCHAANCFVIGQAALHGWPHATDDDDINAVVALATDTLPQNADEIYKPLQQAASDGLDLSSHHGAVKSAHRTARWGTSWNMATPPSLLPLSSRRQPIWRSGWAPTLLDAPGTLGHVLRTRGQIRPGIRPRRKPP